MHNSIDDVLAFVENNPDYRATIGLIKTRKRAPFLPYLGSGQRIYRRASGALPVSH